MPSSSTRAFASSARSSAVYGPAGFDVAPTPRLSKVSTRYPASSRAGVWYAQVSFSSARPLISTTVCSPSPSRVYAMSMPFTAAVGMGLLGSGGCGALVELAEELLGEAEVLLGEGRRLVGPPLGDGAGEAGVLGDGPLTHPGGVRLPVEAERHLLLQAEAQLCELRVVRGGGDRLVHLDVGEAGRIPVGARA